MEARGELHFARLSSGQYVFVVYLAYDAREVSVEHVCLAAESEEDMHKWMHAIRLASGWLYYAPCTQPLARRLSGLLVVELIGVENVVAGDWNGKSDPYILLEFEGQLARTPTHYRKLTTSFNHVVTLPVHNDDPNLCLNLLVFDEDTLSTDDLLGGLSVPLHALGFNKEIVWDSVPLRHVAGSLRGRLGGSDQYGTVSFRTLFRSSKLTQFLPRKQVPGDEERSRVILQHQESAHALQDYKKKLILRRPSLGNNLESSSSDHHHSDEDSDPKNDDNSPHSRAASPKMAASKRVDQEDERVIDFSIEMFKIQIMRIVGLSRLFSVFKSFKYFLAWRDPFHTTVQYAWITWVCWLEPQSALMFWFVLVLKLLVQAHPCFPDLVHEVSHYFTTPSDEQPPKEEQSDDAKKSHVLSPSGQKMMTSPMGDAGGTSEIRVYECQRRRIAGAMAMLSTMVKVTTVIPAKMAVAAGTAVASPLLPRDVKEDNLTAGAEKVTQSAKKDIENLFIHFSGSNLHNNEHEWVSSAGVALRESPSTVINGFKIKWSVFTKKNCTDKNGWEYARSFPQLGGDRDWEMWGSSVRFAAKMKIHKHWVRRRVWVGRPIRPAFESEEPIKLSEMVEEGSEKVAEEGEKFSLYGKFKQFMDEGRKFQIYLFKFASQLESVKNLFSWKSRWITSLMFWLLIVFLFLSLCFSQSVLVWAIITFVLIDQLMDANRKMRLMQPLLDAIRSEINENRSPLRKSLGKKLASFSANMVEITLDVPVSVLLPIFQRACDKVWFPNAVALTLEDLDTNADEGGPVTLGILLERIYLAAHHGDPDWWKSPKTTIHPKNLFRDHLVSDWEQYNPTSLFCNKRSS